MPSALLRAFVALRAPALQRVVLLALGLSALSFGLLWLAIAVILHDLLRFSWPLFDWLVAALGGVAVLGLSWLLFPAVVTLFMSGFLDRVAGAVEALDYPRQEPPRRQPFGEVVIVMLRLAAVTLALNLLALPFYLLAPGLNLVLFLALNGYLLGRGYFELVALRRLDAAAARAMRSRFGGRIFVGGMVIAALFALPIVGLVAPVVATAFMVHLFEALSRVGPSAALRPAE